ncbi:MAG: hypothetical protein R3C49_24315 [Planctomycetaceae bacterium]
MPSDQPAISTADGHSAEQLATDAQPEHVGFPATMQEADRLSVGPGEFPGIRRPFLSLWWLFQVLLGIGFLLPLLAGLAAFPGFSLLALGFLLDAEAEVGRSGKLRNGFPLLPISTRVGTIGLMTFLFLLPVMAISSIAGAQEVIRDVSGLSPGGLRTVKTVLQILVFIHVLLAIANGGSFGAFLSPFRLIYRLHVHALRVIQRRRSLFDFSEPVNNLHQVWQRWRRGTLWTEINQWTERLIHLFRPWHHLKLAIMGAVGALCWLIIPTILLGVGSTTARPDPGPGVLVSLLGGILMIPVAAWLPLLQCHQAATGRFRAIFEVRVAREIISRVPMPGRRHDSDVRAGCPFVPVQNRPAACGCLLAVYSAVHHCDLSNPNSHGLGLRHGHTADIIFDNPAAVAIQVLHDSAAGTVRSDPVPAATHQRSRSPRDVRKSRFPAARPQWPVRTAMTGFPQKVYTGVHPS